ncbi:hypothetical protein M408DRAFT_28508 [Serendipita vermifera MAFF 305830]|uniref:PH domain-containing protein n=1 Tax=Serendipita vermifera MAFF 305830 TaxID=933852 RepID=A0A0C3ADF9_SERVB|nr:hypothetical protein M408DRAFT_28508 [Serendipita vermifera MAFF 305830]
MSLAPLSRRLSSTSTLPIFCRYTAEAIGSCRVDIKIASVTPPPKSRNGSNVSTRASSPIGTNIQPGSKVNFFLSVDQVKGLGSNDFASIHLQIRLASITGPSTKSQDVYPPLQLISRVPAHTGVSARRLHSNRALCFLQVAYLERMERWDEMREQRNILPKPNGSAPTNSNPNLPAMRRSENDFVVEQVHDVVSWLTICELGSDGKYNPVPVLSQSPLHAGSFSLRQGLQRCLRLALSSNSGKQLPWVAVTQIRIGNIRLLDGKGRAHESESKELIEIKLGKQQNVEFKPDGSGTLSIDTPMGLFHARLSPLEQGYRFRPEDPSSNQLARDAGAPSRFASMFSSTKRLAKTRAIFSLKLMPSLTRSPKDLWRLDTSEKYVRGEEALRPWRPRGISVVEDYDRLVATEKRSADVQAIKVILASSPPQPYSGGRPQEDVLRDTLAFWQKKFGHRGQIILSQEPDEEDAIPTPALEPPVPLKLVAQTKLVPRSDMSTKAGYLLLLTEAGENTWQKLWFVLRRPHLYIYSQSNELEEVGVISLTGVKVESSVDMVALLGKPHLFTLFTSSNSHVFSAPNEKELHAWISKLDPTRIPSP